MIELSLINWTRLWIHEFFEQINKNIHKINETINYFVIDGIWIDELNFRNVRSINLTEYYIKSEKT